MRKIEFTPGTHQGTKDRVNTLAWATNRRGRNPWKSRNVTSQIMEYVNAAGYAYDSVDAQAAMKWLIENKYAHRRIQEGGKRTIEFTILGDVDLNGHMPTGPKLLADGNRTSIGNGKQHLSAARSTVVKQLEHERGVAVLQEAVHPTNGVTPEVVAVPATPAPPPVPVDIDIPLPGAPARPELYGLNNFVDLAYAWADVNPDGWADWVDRATESLSAQLH